MFVSLVLVSMIGINSCSKSDDTPITAKTTSQEEPNNRPSAPTPSETTTYVTDLPVFKDTVICISSVCPSGMKRFSPIFKSFSDPSKLYFFPDSGDLRIEEGQSTPSFGFFRTKDPDHEVGGAFSGMFEHEVSPLVKIDFDSLIAQGKKLYLFAPIKSFFALQKDEFFIPTYEQVYRQASFPSMAGRAEDAIGFSATLTQLGADYLNQIFSGKRPGGLSFEYCAKVSGVTPALPGYAKVDLNKLFEELKAKYYKGEFLINVVRRGELIKYLSSLVASKQIDYQMSVLELDFFLAYLIQDLVKMGMLSETSMKFENPLNPDYSVNTKYEMLEAEKKYTFNQPRSIEVSICKHFAIGAIFKKYPSLYREI